MSEGIISKSDQLNELVAAAHELKTPLTIIAHLAAAIQDEALELSIAEQKTALQRIRLSADRTLRLVQGLTTSYRLEHDDQLAFHFALEPLNIAQLCEEVAQEILPFAAAQSQSLELQVGRAQLIVGNSDLARSVLFNLLDNAIRHNPPDTKVRLAMRRRQEVVRVCVQDNGPGFNPNDFRRLRQTLGRLAQPLQGRSSSSGLGLYIAGEMAAAMGGKLGVGSAKQGADFHVDFLHSKQLSFL